MFGGKCQVYKPQIGAYPRFLTVKKFKKKIFDSLQKPIELDTS